MAEKELVQQLGPEATRSLLEACEWAMSFGTKLKGYHMLLELESDDGRSSQIGKRMHWESSSILQATLFNASLIIGLDLIGGLRESHELKSTPEDPDEGEENG